MKLIEENTKFLKDLSWPFLISEKDWRDGEKILQELGSSPTFASTAVAKKSACCESSSPESHPKCLMSYMGIFPVSTGAGLGTSSNIYIYPHIYIYTYIHIYIYMCVYYILILFDSKNPPIPPRNWHSRCKALIWAHCWSKDASSAHRRRVSL